MVTLKSIYIKNFKCICEKSISLTKLNEVYGKNRSGKTAILEAVQFALTGGKNDVSKIKHGAEKAEVNLELFDGKMPITINSSINRKGQVQCSLKINKIKAQNPRTHLKKFLNFGTFNPREMLDKKGRTERLLSLIPIPLKKEQLLIPDTDKPFPINDINSIDFDQHGFKVMQAVDRDMRNVRLSLGQKKDLLGKSYKRNLEAQQSKIEAFKKEHNEDPLSGDSEDIEKVSIKQGNLENQRSSMAGNFIDCANIIKITKGKLHNRQYEEQSIISKIKDYENMLKTLKEKLIEVKENNAKDKIHLKEREDEYEDLKKKIHANDLELSKFSSRKMKAREVQEIKTQAKSLGDQNKDFQEAERLWAKQDHLVKVKFPEFQRLILKKFEDRVPGLTLKDGTLVYNNTSLDELSGAEVIELSLKLMALGSGGQFVFINEFEALDLDSIRDIDFSNFQALVARVSDTPINGDWNSIKMFNENENQSQ